jgi:hypothetical protein
LIIDLKLLLYNSIKFLTLLNLASFSFNWPAKFPKGRAKVEIISGTIFLGTISVD